MNRTDIADLILARIKPVSQQLRKSWDASGGVRHVVIDDLLPNELASRIRASFPADSAMQVRRSLRELKFIAAQMDRYDPLLEESIFAFQDPRVIQVVADITNLRAIEPDEHLYAGGISMMVRGHFLNPHIDNSHDKSRQRYRVLNLLYYISPEWRLENGGNLELWPQGIEGRQETVESRFNRLVIMITNTCSWHSVSPVKSSDARCCVSNYYFSKLPAETADYYHVTSYRGRPGQEVRDWLLRADNVLKTMIMKSALRHFIDNPHFYDKKNRK